MPRKNPTRALAGTVGEAQAGRARRWRLPIAYGAIPGTALAVDLLLIGASAFGAEALYHNIPAEFAGEFSHVMASAMFVAVLFVAVDASATPL